MIYMDPPYGVKFGSNFQPFVRKRDVKHGKDDFMIREPEMVKAYRDTWELGIHSYLTYLRDRLLLAKELLHESGSIFVQISDENLNYVKEVMDDVFSKNNYCQIIPFRKKLMPLGANLLEGMCDYIVWYAKSKPSVKFNKIYQKSVPNPNSRWTNVELPDGIRRSLTADEKKNLDILPLGSKVYRLVSQRAPSYSEANDYVYEFLGKKYPPPKGGCWVTSKDKMDLLALEQRLEPEGDSLSYIWYHDDYPFSKINNFWTDTSPVQKKSYVVQTTDLAVTRCILMTSDPGDLVLDTTCGSGTTAVTAERLGRRWITCDTSRVPLALARQRLLTATFPWYKLKDSQRGPSAGFVYQRKQNYKGEEIGGLVPRITLKSIANNEEPETVTLVDKPEINKTITRVCGPFTVEATIQAAGSLLEEQHAVREHAMVYHDPRLYIDRMIEVLRKSQRLSLPGNKKLELENVRPLSAEDCEFLHAEAIEQNGAEKRIAIAFGPQESSINSDMVFNTASEARFLKFDALYFFGFAIQAKAREMISDQGKLRLPCTYVAVTPDVVMSDLLKTSRADQIFSITGLPDIEFIKSKTTADKGDALYQVTLMGLDIFIPHNMQTESIEANNLPCWMLDTDYNGMSFCARQVFFPKTSAWDNLQKSLKGRFDDSVWEHLAGTTSEPFLLGKYQAIAVKVIDERGNELMVVRKAAEAH
jgi:adenine-specific DNA-methyltransferase